VTDALPTPIGALKRAVYLLDRGQVSSVLVDEFHSALGVVSELGPDGIESRVRNDSLAGVEGIGTASHEVIVAAVRGVPCTYVARLERDTRVATEGGGELRAALKGDCRCRSVPLQSLAPLEISSGTTAVPEMADAALALGHEYLVVADRLAQPALDPGQNDPGQNDPEQIERGHDQDRRSDNSIDERRLRSQLAEIAVLNMGLAPFRVLTGIEIDLASDGVSTMSADLIAALDIVVVTVAPNQSGLPPSTNQPDATGRLLTAIANPNVDIISFASPDRTLTASGQATSGTSSSTGSNRESASFDAEAVFAACNTYDKAVEVGSRPDQQNISEELLDVALAWGTKFVISSGARAPGQLEWLDCGASVATSAGIDPARVVNTWDADQLISWAANHPA